MQESIISAGIDVGTSTTQVIFSKMKIKNIGGFGSVPKVEIVEKQVIYQSEIHFTPLVSENEIDAEKVKSIVKSEYEKAGIQPCDVDTGAVIITGETVRKKNSSAVATALSELAGDFVVASAGADLESVLAGKGSGIGLICENTEKTVANFDIGGGTTNICVMKNSTVVDTACFDIGGRLIRLDENQNVIYISKKLEWLCSQNKIKVSVGETLSLNKAEKICDAMVGVLEKILLSETYSLGEMGETLDFMATNHGLNGENLPEIITFSGGVADCLYNERENAFEYGDLGVVLARCIKKSKILMGMAKAKPTETIRATVIGVGNFSMDVSGSTIEHYGCEFPIKSIPVEKIHVVGAEDLKSVVSQVENVLNRFDGDRLVISMKGIACPTFLQIEELAESLCLGLKPRIDEGKSIIIATQADIGKALGQALKRRLKGRCAMLCLDQISCESGDFLDIGKPIVGGKVLPVIVKTLIFN